jgi:CubicO group peptidase (beta-lactamase class C family)
MQSANGGRVHAETPFGSASVSKAVVATLLLRLLDDAGLASTTPASTLCSSFGAYGESVRRITLADMLSHSSGLAGDYFVDYAADPDPLASYTRALLSLGTDNYRDDIGSYCSGAYVAAAHIIERYSSRPFADLLAPWHLTTARPAGAATGHRRDPSGANIPWPRASLPACLWPAGGLFGSAPALARFGYETLCDSATRLREPIRSQATRLIARVPHSRSAVAGWGLGWTIYHGYNGRVVGSDGQGDGYGAHLRIAPDCGVSVAVLTGRYEAGAAVTRFLADVLAVGGVHRIARPHAEVRLATDAANVVGTYRRHGVSCDVVEESGSLFVDERPDEWIVPFVGARGIRGLLAAEPDGTFTCASGTSRTVVAFPLSADGTASLYMNDRRARRVGDETPIC